MHTFLCAAGHSFLVECDLPIVVCLEHLAFARLTDASPWPTSADGSADAARPALEGAGPAA